MTNTPSPKLASNLYYFLHSGAKFELLSVSGVILGSGAVCDAGAFRVDIFALALLTTCRFRCQATTPTTTATQ